MTGQLPPAFEANQKILDPDIMDILVSNAPQSHWELMTDQGFDAQTATTDQFEQFVEICERAETKEALRNNTGRCDHDDSSDDERPTRKTTKKHRTTEHTKSKRLPFHCKEHDPNTTHGSRDTAKSSTVPRKKPMTGRRNNNTRTLV
jgi:hypothetical protein